jgi:hypothetical protein
MPLFGANSQIPGTRSKTACLLRTSLLLHKSCTAYQLPSACTLGEWVMFGFRNNAKILAIGRSYWV